MIDGGRRDGRVGAEGPEIGEHERAVLSLFFVLVVGLRGIEVNAGASFKRREECGSHAHPEPPGQAVQLLVGRILHNNREIERDG